LKCFAARAPSGQLGVLRGRVVLRLDSGLRRNDGVGLSLSRTLPRHLHAQTKQVVLRQSPGTRGSGLYEIATSSAWFCGTAILAVHRMHGLEAHATIIFSGLQRDASQ